MTRTLIVSTLICLGLFALAPCARAQVATVRGKVLDEAGQPLAAVNVEMEFKGESRQKIVKTVVTDKKGGYVRSGLASGPYKMTFSKEGYKPYSMEVAISLGGFSELPDQVLHPAAAAAPAGAAPVEAVLPPEPDSAKTEAAYAKAVEATKAGRLDEAEGLYREVLAKFPDLAGAHYNLAYLHQLRKNWKAAEGEYLRVTELQPTRSDAFIALAAVRELDGREGDAVEGLLQAAPGFEQEARFQYALGVTSLNAGRPREGAAAFKKMAELDPANPEPYYHLATLAVGENRVAEAVAQLEKYVGMSGQDPRNLQTAKRLLEALKKK